MTAQSRGWGGPPVARARVNGGAQAPVSGAEFPGGVHDQTVRLTETLLEATERRGYECTPGWCWGYAARRIRGSDRWSNHAWALAVDINAPNNPMTSRLVTDMPSWMPRMWEDCGFRWGGRYKTRPDAMHYEYMGRPQDVAKHLAKAKEYLRTAGGGQTSVQEEDEDMKRGDKGNHVKRLQWRINQVLHGHHDPEGGGLKVDGDYGPDTEAYVKHVQKQAGYPTTGRVEWWTYDYMSEVAHKRVDHEA